MPEWMLASTSALLPVSFARLMLITMQRLFKCQHSKTWCEQKLLRFSCRTFKDGKDEVTENKQET
jgi:hypothetical protein